MYIFIFIQNWKNSIWEKCTDCKSFLSIYIKHNSVSLWMGHVLFVPYTQDVCPPHCHEGHGGLGGQGGHGLAKTFVWKLFLTWFLILRKIFTETNVDLKKLTKKWCRLEREKNVDQRKKYLPKLLFNEYFCSEFL